jgi:hypothetical protein
VGFLDDLLTGEGPSLETRSLSTIDEEQRKKLNELLAQLSGRPQRDASSFTAPLSSGEMTSLAALEERSKQLAMPDATMGNAKGSLDKLLDFEGQTASVDDYFKNAVQNPLLDSFSREIMPAISRDFGGADFFSSERQNAEGLARQDLLQTLTGERSKVALDQFNQSRDRALTAAGLVPGLEQAEGMRTQQMTQILEALGLPRNIAQAGLDKQLEQQNTEDELMSRLALTPTIENIGMTNPGSPGIINLLLGGAAEGLGGVLGEGGGNWLQDLLGGLLGGKEEGASGETPADNMPPGSPNGTTSGGSPVPIPGIPSGTTPGGTVTVGDGPQGQSPVTNTGTLPNGVGLPAAGIAGGIGASMVGAPAGTVAIEGVAGTATTAATQGGQAASQAATTAGSTAGVGGTALQTLGYAAAIYGAYEGAQALAESYKRGDVKGGLVAGATAGASVGSLFGPVGAAAGGIIGGAAGALGVNFGGNDNADKDAWDAFVKAGDQGATTFRDSGFPLSSAIDGSMKATGYSQMQKAMGGRGSQQPQLMVRNFLVKEIESAIAAGKLPNDDKALSLLNGKGFFEKEIAAKLWPDGNVDQDLRDLIGHATDNLFQYGRAGWTDQTPGSAGNQWASVDMRTLSEMANNPSLGHKQYEAQQELDRRNRG